MTRRRTLLQAGAALWLADAAQAQTGAADPAASAPASATLSSSLPPEPPPAGPPLPVVVPPLHEHRLANGMSVVIAPRRGLPLLSASVMVRAGGVADPRGQAGLADLCAELLTKGVTRNGREVPAPELAREAEALGGALGSGGGWRSSSVGMTVVTRNAEPMLALLADVVQRPTLAQAELERSRTQAADALRVAMQSPGGVAGRVARRLHWGASPYGAVVTAGSLSRIRRADVQRFHAAHFRPSDALLVLCGDIDADAGLALAQRHFGGWRAVSGATHGVAGGAAAQPLAPSRVLVDLPGSGQLAVVLAAPFAPLGDDAALPVGRVLNAVLGAGYTSRLSQEIRIKRGLSYDVSSAPEQFPQGGMWSAASQTKPASAAEVAALMQEQIARIRSEPVGTDELAARQSMLIGGFARRLESNAGIASLVASQWVNQRPLAALGRYVEDTLAVTPAQLRDYAARWWPDDALRTVIVGDLGAAGLKDAKSDGGGGTLRLDAGRIEFDAAGLRQRSAAPPRAPAKARR